MLTSALCTFLVMSVLSTSQAGDPCHPNICRNGGVCVVVIGNPSCACAAGFAGQYCEQKTGGPPPTTAAPAPVTSTCPAPVCSAIYSCDLGCKPAEVIFMIEYAKVDVNDAVKLEAEFVLEHIDHWTVDKDHVRVGVVVYHDTVSEVIHVDQYQDDVAALKTRIMRIARGLNPSGEADLAGAFDYVREFSFTGARPGAARVVIPFINNMPAAKTSLDTIVESANKLKQTCVSIIAFGVHHEHTQPSSINYDTVKQLVSKPVKGHFEVFDTFYDLATYYIGIKCR